jgi:hypothetical protein
MHALFETNQGNFKVKLFNDRTPKTVENFVGLAEGTKEFTDPKTGAKTKRPFYDGLNFHRVIKDAHWELAPVIQDTVSLTKSFRVKTATRNQVCFQWPTPVQIQTAANFLSRLFQLRGWIVVTQYLVKLLKAMMLSTTFQK